MQRSDHAYGEVLILDRDYYGCQAGGQARTLVHARVRVWLLRMVSVRLALQLPMALSPSPWGYLAATHAGGGRSADMVVYFA